MSDIRVFAAPSLQAYAGFKGLIRDFRIYKQTGKSGFDTVKFGKDVSFDRPQSAVFEPDAHAMSRSTLIMSKVAEMAEVFRSQY